MAKQRRPVKPYPQFPLFPHAAGVWAKKIRGRLVYFGPWSDPDGALERYLRDRDHLYAGKAPPLTADGITLDELVNRFLADQEGRVAAGEVGVRHHADCRRDGRRLLEILGRSTPVAGLTPLDFSRLKSVLSEGRSATTVGNVIIRLRGIFRWGADSRLLERAVFYGRQFSAPSPRLRRQALQAGGDRDLSAEAIRALLAKLDGRPRLANLRAAVLLGINCGLGNTDCAMLAWRHLDLRSGMLDFPRPKTGVARRAALWPETVAALKAIRSDRRKVELPPDVAPLALVTSHRRPMLHYDSQGRPLDALGTEFARLLDDCKLARKGLGFYCLRRSFRTAADSLLDFPAIDLVMGHAAESASGGSAPFSVAMAARYRQRISDDRLRAVAAHVHQWLWGDGAQNRPAGQAKAGSARAG